MRLDSHNYQCGYCGRSLASEKGWVLRNQPTGLAQGHIYICHFCSKPTYFDRNFEEQTPGVTFGEYVQGIGDESVQDLYNEARRCIGVKAFTATVLCCRKLLMHIAVLKGAATELKFIEYVEYLSNNNYIPPDAKDWVNHIRKKGNEANHEITIMDEESATDLLRFSSMLLKIIYEFPATVKKRGSS